MEKKEIYKLKPEVKLIGSVVLGVLITFFTGGIPSLFYPQYKEFDVVYRGVPYAWLKTTFIDWPGPRYDILWFGFIFDIVFWTLTSLTFLTFMYPVVKPFFMERMRCPECGSVLIERIPRWVTAPGSGRAGPIVFTFSYRYRCKECHAEWRDWP